MSETAKTLAERLPFVFVVRCRRCGEVVAFAVDDGVVSASELNDRKCSNLVVTREPSPVTTRGGCRCVLVPPAAAHKLATYDALLAALKAVVAIADRRTVEFDDARAAIAAAEERP